jgi:hypothetical protein
LAKSRKTPPKGGVFYCFYIQGCPWPHYAYYAQSA